MAKQKKPKKPGPKSETLKIQTDWRSAAKKAMGKPRPADGWPKTDKDESDKE